MSSNFFENLERKTGVKMGEITSFAQSIQNANFKDKATVRKIVRGISKLANKPVSRQKENLIVDAIVSGRVPANMSDIEKMMH